jgi:NSS family neurotransmitter:Na+ symporter
MPLSRGALGQWRSRTTFVLALSASAVGLGNLWRFPYLLGEHGGGPFMLAYLACLFLVAAPLLIAEVVIGSHGRGSPPVAMRWAADRSLRSRAWVLAGLIACLAGLLLLAVYAVVAGWSMAFAAATVRGEFGAASVLEVSTFFRGLVNDVSASLAWITLFIAAVTGIVALGIRQGIGLFVWFAVPAMFALLFILVDFALTHGDLVAAGEFLFAFQTLDFDARSLLVALSHAFYTLGIGVGVGITYGAYSQSRIPVARSVLAVALFDAALAVMAGVAVMPLVFAANVEPGMGPTLTFVAMPYVFGNVADGELYGTLFFVLVLIVALGSAVALLEPLVGALKQHLRLRRLTAAVIAGGVLWCLSALAAISLAGDSDPGLPWFRLLDQLATYWLIPLAALLLALFVGWQMQPVLRREQLYRAGPVLYGGWLFLLRYVSVPAIIVILLANLVRHG